MPARLGDVKRAIGRLGDAFPRQILLASDFDGTLAPIVPRPEAAEAMPANLTMIQRLIELGVHVAVISGRATHDLRFRLPLSATRIFGENGMGGSTEAERDNLARFNKKAKRLVAKMAGVWIERKPGSVSFHYRNAPDAGPALLAAVAPLADAFGLVATRGRMVIEAAPGRSDKSRAMAVLIAGLQPKVVIYAGDDEPDRPVFRLLRNSQRRHIAIGVSSEERSVESFPDCDLVVEGPEGMAVFLRSLLEKVARHLPG